MKEMRATDSLLTKAKKIHMIGIGGSGMCPLAEILHTKGYEITGSDNNEGDTLNRIKNLGIKVYMGHEASNIGDAELLVYSAAISKDNPEIVAAEKVGIPTMERSVLLGALTRCYDNVIGVAGTHGKTTTSSMITQILYLSGKDPSAVIGGRLPIINSNGICGKSDILVCESCEFVDTFLQMSPDVSVLLNIDNDHLDYFGSMERLTESFTKFVNMSSLAFLNYDDPLVAEAAKVIKANKVSFGFRENCDYRATDAKPSKFGYKFTVLAKGEYVTELDLHVPGKHNIYNALAAVAVCHKLGVSGQEIKEAIEKFTGAGRRFEFLGEFDSFVLADDYAHHPTEIKATLKAAKDLNYKRVIAVFQPFTFSRTALLLNDFIDALSVADKVILTPIMGSREINKWGISSSDIAKGLNDCTCVEDFNEAKDTVLKITQEGDIVITMGGGDIYKVAKMLLNELKK